MLHKTGKVKSKAQWKETPEYWRARTLGSSTKESCTLGAESTQRKAVCDADSRAREMELLKPLEHKQSHHRLQMLNLEPQNLYGGNIKGLLLLLLFGYTSVHS